ncbi:beta-glucosidase [Paraburkholderia xenovorans]|uniref:beta-glucosidase n=1 Tax=Paraburkholderia xenovorans TaxID=36873 RepID=UPI00345B2E40
MLRLRDCAVSSYRGVSSAELKRCSESCRKFDVVLTSSGVAPIVALLAARECRVLRRFPPPALAATRFSLLTELPEPFISDSTRIGTMLMIHRGRSCLFQSRLSGRAARSALVVLLAFSSGSYAQVKLQLVNAPGSQVTPTSGKKILRFEVLPPDIPRATKITVGVYPYDSDGKVLPTRLASYENTIGRMQDGKAFNVAVTIPRMGLFRIEATLKSPDGETLDKTTSTLAIVTKRTELGPPDFGVGTHFGQDGTPPPSVLLPLVKQAGFSWIRDDIYWDTVEKKAGVFVFPKRYDAYLALSKQLGISPLVVLDEGNPRAYPKLFSKSNFPLSPEARARFADYVDAVVARYGDNAVTAPYGGAVQYWEVWNEPDFSKISYADYAALLWETFGAIKDVNPAASVIACGGGGAGGGPGGDCVVGLIKEGALNDQSGFSIHPYMSPHTPEKGYKTEGAPIDFVNIPTVWPYLRDFTADHMKADGRPLQVWVTEMGWPVNPKEPGQDEATQAANLVRSYLLSRRYGTVRVLFWYDFVDDGTDLDNIEHNFGLLHHDLTPKPAFVAASVLSSTVGKRAWAKALVDDESVKAYQYGTDDPVFVGWTVDGNQRVASISLPPGEYIQRDWQGVDTPVTITAQNFRWRVGPVPRYLMPARR